MSEPIDTIELGNGWTANIYRDEHPGNPWEEWEGEPPIAVLYDRDLRDESGLVSGALSHVTDWKLARHWKDILAKLDGAFFAEFENNVHRDARDFGVSLATARRELMQELFTGSTDSDRMEAAAECYRIAGIPALCTSSSGYSQGDYAELLIVAPPEWVKFTGAPRDTHERQLKAAAELYGAWAWGDVYGYVIARPDGEETDESCWGFYGSDYGRSGLKESARDNLRCAMATAAGELATAMRELQSIRATAWPKRLARVSQARELVATVRALCPMLGIDQTVTAG